MVQRSSPSGNQRHSVLANPSLYRYGLCNRSSLVSVYTDSGFARHWLWVSKEHAALSGKHHGTSGQTGWFWWRQACRFSSCPWLARLFQMCLGLGVLWLGLGTVLVFAACSHNFKLTSVCKIRIWHHDVVPIFVVNFVALRIHVLEIWLVAKNHQEGKCVRLTSATCLTCTSAAFIGGLGGGR